MDCTRTCIHDRLAVGNATIGEISMTEQTEKDLEPIYDHSFLVRGDELWFPDRESIFTVTDNSVFILQCQNDDGEELDIVYSDGVFTTGQDTRSYDSLVRVID